MGKPVYHPKRKTMIRFLATCLSTLMLGLIAQTPLSAQRVDGSNFVLFSEAPTAWETQRASLWSEVDRPGDAALIQLDTEAFAAVREADLDAWSLTCLLYTSDAADE